MLVKSYDLTGGALDWAVAKLYLSGSSLFDNPDFVLEFVDKPNRSKWRYSTQDWTAMQAIKKYKISLMHVEADDPYPIDDGPWSANIPGQEYACTGPTPEIAICRCVVAYKLGEDIEVPDELLKDK